MKINYSNHARKRMLEGGIKEENVKSALEFPEYTIVRGREIEAYKKIEGRMLKVIYI